MDPSVLSECHHPHLAPITRTRAQQNVNFYLHLFAKVGRQSLWADPSLNILYNDAMPSFSFSLPVACIALKVQPTGGEDPAAKLSSCPKCTFLGAATDSGSISGTLAKEGLH